MNHFECDYTQGAHPQIMEMLVKTNMEQTTGYGEDIYCTKAADLIKKKCSSPKSYVQFLVGGTQTNATVIDATLRPWQGVISADTGHINVHETGAIESDGHKVLAIKGENGKISADQVEEYCNIHEKDDSREHTVQPAMVYISNPTELGTLYSKEEIMKISDICKKKNLLFFIDGARLGYGLMAQENDVMLSDYAKYSDVFYIGGTKVGALFGEAVVIQNEQLKVNFRYMIKQHGGMLAKGRLLGIQFLTLFQDDLYEKIAKNAVEQAVRLKKAFEEKKIKMFIDSPTNQQFPILNKEQRDYLGQKNIFSLWEELDAQYCAVRFCTSWATTKEEIDELIADINMLS